jgi:hypothetical protein
MTGVTLAFMLVSTAPTDQVMGMQPLTSLGLSDEVVRPIEDVLVGEMRKLLGDRLVPIRSNTDAVARFSRCGGVLACLVDEARNIGWHQMVIGNVAGLGDERVVLLKLVDVDRGHSVRRALSPATGDSGELVQKMRATAVQLVAPERYVGSIRLRAPQHGVRIIVDGEPVGVGPLHSVVEVTVGRHAIEAAGDGLVPLATVAVVTYEGLTPVDIELADSSVFASSSTPFRNRWWTWAMAAVGVASVSAGVYFNVQHLDTSHKIDALVDAGRHDYRAASLHRDQSQQWTAAAILYGSGGALLAGSGLLLTFDFL